MSAAKFVRVVAVGRRCRFLHAQPGLLYAYGVGDKIAKRALHARHIGTSPRAFATPACPRERSSSNPVDTARDGCDCAGGGPPMTASCVDEPERERKADQDDERPEQLAPGRVLGAREPRGEDPDDRH